MERKKSAVPVVNRKANVGGGPQYHLSAGGLPALAPGRTAAQRLNDFVKSSVAFTTTFFS